ncbi:MAG: hypothetical protein ACT4P7_04930 [Gemmatimonadaceae bacterium]
MARAAQDGCLSFVRHAVGRVRRGAVLGAVLLAGVARNGAAQNTAGPRIEGRLEAISARHTTLQLGGGFNTAAGTYVRVGLAAAGGLTRRGGRTRGTARVDGVLRFLLDPFKEQRRGLYGLAGVSAMDDGTRAWEPRVFVGLGLEGRGGRQIIPAVEIALGGGLRVAGVFRRARTNRR